MTKEIIDNKLSQDTQNLISASTREEVLSIENNKKLQEQYEGRIRSVETDYTKAVQENSELGLKKVDLERELNRERAEKESFT